MSSKKTRRKSVKVKSENIEEKPRVEEPSVVEETAKCGLKDKFEGKKQELRNLLNRETLEEKVRAFADETKKFAVSTEAELNSENPPLTDEEYKRMMANENHASNLFYLAGFLGGMYWPWSKVPKWLKYSSYALMFDNIARDIPPKIDMLRNRVNRKKEDGSETPQTVKKYPGIIGRARELRNYIREKHPDYAKTEDRMVETLKGYVRKEPEK